MYNTQTTPNDTPTAMTDIERFKNIAEEMFALYKRKNADYGDSYHKLFQEYGAYPNLIRLEDKLNRLKQLLRGGTRSVTDESVIDTITDLANYAILFRIELEKL